MRGQRPRPFPEVVGGGPYRDRVIDFLLGLYFAGLALRGWMRGLVREAMDLAGLVVGIVAAVRWNGPVAEWLTGWAGATPGLARVIGAIIVFMAVGIAAAIAAHYFSRLMKRPGLNLSNRLLGLVLAIAWGWFLATAIVTLLRVVPLPPTVEEQLDQSTFVEVLADPTIPTQRPFHAIDSDRVLEGLLALRDLAGGEQTTILEDGDVATIPAAAESELSRNGDAEMEIFELLNGARVDEGESPLTFSAELADVAAAHATDMYVNGYFAHESPTTGTVGDRLRAADIVFTFAGENLALSVTSELAHAGLMGSPSHRQNILRDVYRRVGVAAVRGPSGLMVVQVFSG